MAVRHLRLERLDATPLGLGMFAPVSQGSFPLCGTTLGFGTESRWDSALADPPTSRSFFGRLVFALAVGAAAWGSAGCKTYQQQNAGIPLWKQGNIAAAAKAFTAKADKEKNSKDTVIWRLEQGTALRATGQFKESLAAFEQAEQRMERYDEQAKVKLGRETEALLSNQANLPYQGRDYDKVMLSAYKALDYLQLYELEKARPELIRAYQRQQDAVENNKKRIEREEEEIRKAASQESAQTRSSAEKARQDPAFRERLNATYRDLDTLRAYADYVNPFPVYLDGIYFLHLSAGATDLERARKSFERTRSFTGDNKFVRQDLQTVEKALAGEPVPPVTYVLFETGSAPVREQIRLDIPLFFIGQGNVPYVGAAFPTLRFDNHYLSSLTVSAGGTTETTVLLASIDSVVGQSFKHELPAIIAKTLLSATIKAGASYGINKAISDQDELAGLFSKIITSLAQAAVNIADTRTWTTLPKEFQFCRIPTPDDGKIVLSAPSGQKADIQVEPNAPHLVCVGSINAASPLIINRVKLK